MDAPQLGKILGQRPEQRHLQVPSPILEELEGEHAHLKNVAGLGAFDGDRPGEEMRARSAGAGGQNLAMAGKDRKAARGVRKVGGFSR